ncbi:hypothetical protein Fmac_020782 [Flemingia macrophylla]|uniref:Auxin efflux carrier component n=1 Tax=Flemingia macrophylla TaxID=520843 RepID=A0ABD1LV12_9FABA
MISSKEIYNVLASIVPLYVPMILAYGSVCWWKIFTPEQCSGINRFVAVFAVPFLNFHFLAFANPYAMNMRFIAADTLQKVVILGGLFVWSTFTKWGSLDLTLTLFSLSALPNTVVVGVPLITAMYGESSASLMSQIFVMQGVVWITLMLVLYEYRAAKRLIAKRFPDNGASIASLTVDSDVSSLDATLDLHSHAQLTHNGDLHVTLRSPSFHYACNSSVVQRASSFNTTRDLQRPKIHDHRNCIPFPDAVKHEESIDVSICPKAMEVKEVDIAVDSIKEVKIEEGNANKKPQMPRASVMTKLTLTMVSRNLMKNPNTYACVLGLAWSLISFRWNIKMPSIVDGSIVILSKTGTGMAMFSLGLFMALQPKTVAGGKTWAAIALVARFLVGPTVIAVTSFLIGVRGVLFRVAIVQAALPQAIISFVFAKEYNLHADILSTAVILGTVISLPVTIVYFVFLGL